MRDMTDKQGRSVNQVRIEVTYCSALQRMRVWPKGAPWECLAPGVVSVTLPAPRWAEYESAWELAMVDCDPVWWGATLAVMRGLAADLVLMSGCDPRGGGCAVRVGSGRSMCDPPRGVLEGAEGG